MHAAPTVSASSASEGHDLLTFLKTWSGRPTVAIVNLDQLTANISHLRRVIGPTVRLMAVVKANG